MEYEIDFDIIGEIMIPLENNLTIKQNNNNNSNLINLESILDKNYKDFRSILFQGELLRLFLIIKIDKLKDISIKDFMNNIYIKFEFDSSCDENEMELKKSTTNHTNNFNLSNNFNNLEETDSSQLISNDVNFSDLFSLQRNTLFNQFSKNNSNNQYNYKNKNYDFISRRINTDNNILIFEVIRHIIVPNKFLNKNLIMKLNIMRKNELEFVNKYNIAEIYNYKIYEEIKEFTIIKTLFKEIKIIRPLQISKSKQIDILPDTSLLEIKVENITSSINFIDKNLKVSRFLKNSNFNPNLNLSDDVINYGMNLIIKEIQVLKEETVVDKKLTINVKSLEQYIKNDTIPLDNVSFNLLNSDFPIEIKPGEELVLMMKIFKSAFIYENIKNNQNSDNINENLYNSINNVNNENSQYLLNNKNLITQNYNFNTQLKRSSTISPNNNQNLLTNSNQNLIINQNSPVIHNFNYKNFNNKIYSLSSKTFVGNNISYNTVSKINVNSSILLNDENDEIIKVVLSTPLILNISSFKFYDNLFMSIPIKWHNEITRFLKIDIEIENNILLHNYFYVNLKAKNISNSQMDLILEIGDSALDFISNLDTEVFDYKGKTTDQIPSILSETKIKNIGIINPNEEKLIDLRFLPLKNGFNSLSNFNIVDKNSNKKFFVVHTNKIYVNEN